MSTYQLASVGHVFYTEFISKEQYTELYNSREAKEKAIERAKITFKDELIYEVSIMDAERDNSTFSADYTSKKKEDINVASTIPYGIYDLTYNNQGPCMSDSSILKQNTVLPIHEELKDIIKKANFSKKNNILIYGQPGNGKTQSIVDLANTIQDIYIINVIKIEALRFLKYLPTDSKKVLLFEEFTETLQRSDKKQVLNFLDGIDSVANCISIMTTNYPKDLEANIIDRPSRVRHFIEYKNPNKGQITTICKHFGLDTTFFDDKDYSVDNIINIINTSKEESISIKEANNRIADKRKFLSDTFKSGGGVMGIGPSVFDDDDDYANGLF